MIMDREDENRDENYFVNGKQKITQIEISDRMEDAFLQYAMSVIVSRALPDVRDGLKPVHRRILYTMYEKNLTPDKPYHKCADTVGSVLGSYHPHGDASVYDALVRLAQPFSMRYTLVDGQGNFGSVDGDPPAAYRYTEARMSKIATEMLTDINKDTVPFMPNYDERLQEPEVLPSRFPNILVNGSIGIAVGMATNIPPHNLGEVIDGVRMVIEQPDCTLDDLMTCIPGPDFPTGGIIMGRNGIKSAYANGTGNLILRSKTHMETIRGKQVIVVTEIPYMVNKAKLIESIADHVKNKKIEGIAHIQDESSREGMRITIELKKDANAQIVLNKLYSFTKLQDTVHVNMLALVNNVPRVLSLKQILEQYRDFQVDVITRRTKYDLEKAKKRAHILQGFVVAIDYIDEVIHILRESQTVAEGKQNLIARFKDLDMTTVLERAGAEPQGYTPDQPVGLSEEQADAIVQMRLGQLTGLEKDKVIKELYELLAKIADYQDILANKERVYAIILQDLEEIRKKYGDARRTEIEDVEGEVEIEDLIPSEEVLVTYTHNGYIKRVPTRDFKTQKRGGIGVNGMKQREEDFVTEMQVCNTHDMLLFLTNFGLVYSMKAYRVPAGNKAARGNNIVNLLPLQEGEKITAMFSVEEDDFTSDKYVSMVTKNGLLKRTSLSEFARVQKNGKRAILLNDGDTLVGVRLTSGTDSLFIATKQGYAIHIDESRVRPQGRSAHGVRAIRLHTGDEVVSMARAREGASLLTITEKGYGKLTAQDEYPQRNRGGYGVINYKVDEERGNVCGIKVVDETDDIMLMTDEGMIIRTSVSPLRQMGRVSKGVRLLHVRDGQKVVTFSRIEQEVRGNFEDIPTDALAEDASPQEQAFAGNLLEDASTEEATTEETPEET